MRGVRVAISNSSTRTARNDTPAPAQRTLSESPAVLSQLSFPDLPDHPERPLRPTDSANGVSRGLWRFRGIIAECLGCGVWPTDRRRMAAAAELNRSQSGAPMRAHASPRLQRRLLVALLLVAAAVAVAEEPANRPPRPEIGPRRGAVVAVVEKVQSAIVNIHSERTIGAAPERERNWELMRTQQRVNGMGTGIIVDPRGYIVTNHHVVDDVQMLRIKLSDGTPFAGRVVARDPEADLAILKIDAHKPLPIIPLGTASDLMVGEPVIAIGNAFGYENTVTTGVVSALKRDVTLNKEISYKQLIQTDASINPGNSGGPLLNVYGELVGVNVAIRAGAQGIGFAIPVDSMLRNAADLMSVRRRNGLS